MRREEWEQENERIRQKIEKRRSDHAARWGCGTAITASILMLTFLGEAGLAGVLCLSPLVGIIVYFAVYKGATLNGILLAGMIGAVIGGGLFYNEGEDDWVAAALVFGTLAIIVYIIDRAFEKET